QIHKAMIGVGWHNHNVAFSQRRFLLSDLGENLAFENEQNLLTLWMFIAARPTCLAGRKLHHRHLRLRSGLKHIEPLLGVTNIGLLHRMILTSNLLSRGVA